MDSPTRPATVPLGLAALRCGFCRARACSETLKAIPHVPHLWGSVSSKASLPSLGPGGQGQQAAPKLPLWILILRATRISSQVSGRW